MLRASGDLVNEDGGRPAFRKNLQDKYQELRLRHQPQLSSSIDRPSHRSTSRAASPLSPNAARLQERLRNVQATFATLRSKHRA